MELIEKWFENYVRSITKLSHEIGSWEGLVNGFLNSSTPPSNMSEAIIDHDYTLLASKKYSEGARQYWSTMLSGLKAMEAKMADPIRQFLRDDVRLYKASFCFVYIDESKPFLINSVARTLADNSSNRKSNSTAFSHGIRPKPRLRSLLLFARMLFNSMKLAKHISKPPWTSV